MFTKIINKIKQKVKKNKFKETLKKEKRKVFIDTSFDKSKFFKRKKQITFNFPKLQNNYIKNNLKMLYLGIIFTFLFLIVVSLFTPIFYIQKINITLYDKQEGLIDLNIAYDLLNNYRGKNLIFLNNSEIEDQLVNYQKNIVNIEINKSFFPSVLNIKLGSSKALFYTIINGKKYIVTENGVFVYTNTIIKDLKEIKISMQNKNDYFLEYKKILHEDYLKKIVKLKNDIEQNILGLKIKNIYYFVKEREVHFDVNNDIKLIFDINVEPDEQLTKLIVFNKEHLSLLKITTINYIDLRIPNKIFYCENEFIGNCKKNLKLIYDLYE
ncbi:MAG: hypothetical protein WC850_04890 [Candidatus Gracilibacteria bacterium]